MIIQRLTKDTIKPLSNTYILYISLFVLIHTLSVGINIATLSIFLNNNNINFSGLIFMISIQFIGGIFSIPFTQYICLRFKVIYSIFFGALIRAIGILMLGLSFSDPFWYTGLFLCGAGTSIIFTCITYILPSIPDNKNEYDISFIIFTFALGFCIGNFCVEYLNFKIDHILFIVSGIISILSIFILASVKDLYIPIKEYKINLKIHMSAYLPIITILYIGYTSTSLIYFLNKYIENQSDHMLFRTMLGTLFFIMPYTYIYTRFNFYHMFFLSILLSCSLIFYIPIALKQYGLESISIIYFLIGGLFSAMFFINIKKLRSVLITENLPYISSIIILLYNLGCFAGIIITGNLIKIEEKNGLVYSIGLVTIIYILYILIFGNKSINSSTTKT
jgi:MFS family permease